MYYSQSARPLGVLGPPPTSPGYPYTNGVPMGPMGLPHPVPHHHHQNSLSHFPSPPSVQPLHQGSPNALMMSTHWQNQLLKCETVRAARSPHHRARQSAIASRSVTKSAIPITNPNQVNQAKPEEPKEEDASANHPSSTVAPIADASRPTSTWHSLDMGGIGVKNLPPSSGLFRFTFLMNLFLNHNSLTSLPPEISNLRRLELLDVSGNALVTLPAELGMLTQLKELYLFDNLITHLPPELGFLHQLQTLGIEGNPLDPSAKSMIQTSGTPTYIAHLRDTCPALLFPPRRQWMPMVSEKEQEAFDADPSLETFSVLCYNILCERCATERLYGYTPSYALQWDYRKKQIFKQITSYDSDFLCLQEVDVGGYEEFFVPRLGELGYEGIYLAKARAKTMSETDRRLVDGCAIFYRSSKYTLVERHDLEFAATAMQRPDFKKDDDMFNRVLDKDHNAVIALLEHKVTGSRLVIANAHIHWNSLFRDVKLVQTVLLVDEVEKVVADFVKYPPRKPQMNGHIDGSDSNSEGLSSRPPISYTDPSKIPVIICGDFNSVPDSGVYEYLSTGHCAADHPDFMGHVYGNFQVDGPRHRLGLRSAYKGYPGPNAIPTPLPGPNERYQLPIAPFPLPPTPLPPYDHPPFENEMALDPRTGSVTNTGGELPFTNYTPSFKGTISYIWYSTGTIGVNKVLGEVDRQYLERVVGFPNIHFPSDHIPILAEFRVKATASNASRSGITSSQSQQAVF